MELTCISPNEVYLDGKLLNLSDSLAIARHSPDGFMWGYHGSGPAQLACAVILKMVGKENLEVPLYQKFKSDVISKLPIDKQVSLEMDFQGWLQGEENYRFEIRELGERVDSTEEENQQKRACTKGHEKNCYFAKSDSCECDCNGENHGGAWK